MTVAISCLPSSPVLVEPTEKDRALLSALRAEAESLGVDWYHASDEEITLLARVIPDEFKAELTALGLRHGWAPESFLVFVLRPLFEDVEHDCRACEREVAAGSTQGKRGAG